MEELNKGTFKINLKPVAQRLIIIHSDHDDHGDYHYPDDYNDHDDHKNVLDHDVYQVQQLAWEKVI